LNKKIYNCYRGHRIIPILKLFFGAVNSDSVDACLIGISIVVEEVKFHVFVGDLSTVGEFKSFNRRFVGFELKLPKVEGLLVLRVHALGKGDTVIKFLQKRKQKPSGKVNNFPFSFSSLLSSLESSCFCFQCLLYVMENIYRN
jgi:hypothetical protein